MTQADMQPCILRGELHTPLLGDALQTASANAFLEPAAAALALKAHSNLVDMTRTEPMSKKIVFCFPRPV